MTCTDLTGHLTGSDHRAQECPTYHDEGDNTSPIGRYEIVVEDGYTATMFAVLSEDGETGDAIFFGYGATLADAIEDLANCIRA